jgi:hypothetical protein
MQKHHDSLIAVTDHAQLQLNTYQHQLHAAQLAGVMFM